jgi:uncharacterized membrane protein
MTLVRDAVAELASPRLPVVDLLRGLAIAQMVIYHFIYDLDYYGWVDLAMTREQPWVAWRTAIVSQFVFLVGIGLGLRSSFRPGPGDFWRRWAQVAGAALLVSVGSAAMFGPRWIWFGVLHFVAAALLLGRPLQRLGAWNLGLGVVLLAIGLSVKLAALNAAPWAAIGLALRKPATEDYVPLLPWFGIVLLGLGAGALWRRAGWTVPPALQRLDSPPARLLRTAGRWPLTIYLLHQPALLGTLWLVRRVL